MLADDITAALPELRTHAESLMLDAGTALETTEDYEYDPVEQAEVRVMRELFTSQAKLQARTIQPREEETGGRTATSVRMELHLPADSDPLATGHIFLFTATHRLSTTPAGSRWRILSPVGKTLATARRYEVERHV